MKRKLFFLCTFAIILLACNALLFSGDFVVYILAYIFSFVFLLCHTVFADSVILEKIVQAFIYALIMAAQIVFDVLVLRDLFEGNNKAYRLGKLIGVLLIFIPFLVKQFLCRIDRKKYTTIGGDEHDD